MNVPVVVVTQREPADWVAGHPDAPFTFVTSKVPEAVEQARARVGEGHVAVTAGTITGHCLELGLPDEVRHDLVLVVMRDGRPFFGAMTSSDVELDNPTVSHPNGSHTSLPGPAMSGSGLTVAVLTPHVAAGLEAELPTITSGRPAALVAPIRPRGSCLRYGFTDTGRVMRGENVLALGLAVRG